MVKSPRGCSAPEGKRYLNSRTEPYKLVAALGPNPLSDISALPLLFAPSPLSPHPSISLCFSLSPSFSLCLPSLTEISRNSQESTPIQEDGATSYTMASSSCFPLCPVKVGTDLRSVKRAEKMIQHTPSVSSASSFTLPCVGKSPSAGPTLLAVPAGED